MEQNGRYTWLIFLLEDLIRYMEMNDLEEVSRQLTPIRDLICKQNDAVRFDNARMTLSSARH